MRYGEHVTYIGPNRRGLSFNKLYPVLNKPGNQQVVRIIDDEGYAMDIDREYLSRFDGATAGDIRMEDDEAKYQEARIKFLKEQMREDPDYILGHIVINDALDELFCDELFDLREDVINPDLEP